MYIPKDINKNLKEEAKRAGRTNRDGMVVAPAWSKLFTQAGYVIAKQADEIERLREALLDAEQQLDAAYRNGYDAAYAMGYSEGLKETLYDKMPRLDDRGDNLDGN